MSDLSSRLAALTPQQRAKLGAQLGVPPATSKAVPIAVIGMGCRFPGNADSPEAFWRLLNNGLDAIRTVPAERWDVDRYFSSDPSSPGRTNSRWGGFLDRIDQFDREFFGLSPRETVHMDPQQRLLLETAWEALEDAGQLTDALAGTAAGVFIGVQSSSADYHLMQARELDGLDTYTGTGTSHSILANRLSFLLDLHGPSMAVDTACSSSLVAVHLACQSLRTGDCDLALAGGINLMLLPNGHIALAKLEMMASDGRCKTFDHRADGFVRGEGCGVIILKRLPDALRDGDPVIAVIPGSAVNQDGASNGLTAPSGPAQQAVIRRALQVAQISPEKVSYVETHGTGTVLGDPIEIEALASALSNGRPDRHPCVLGAVKTNIGHLEAASGIAGLIKGILCLDHGIIPANLHLERVNPHLAIETTPFVLPTQPVPWPRSDEPRVAGVSSFGFGGTNAHVIFSDVPAHDVRSPLEAPRGNALRLLPISARSNAALRALAESYIHYLTTGDGATLPPAHIAYTASVRRLHHDHRMCVLGSSAAEWAAAIRVQLSRPHDELPTIEHSPDIAFAFGDESALANLNLTVAAELFEAEPVFRAAVEQCDALFRQHVSWSLVAQLSPPLGRSSHQQEEIADPIFFAIQVGLTQLWKSWGVVPAVIVASGVGQIAAAWAAGALKLPDAVRVLFHRQQNPHRSSTVDSIQVQNPTTRIISTATGKPAGPADFRGDDWIHRCGDFMQLGKVIRDLSKEGTRLAVNIGFGQPCLHSTDAYLTPYSTAMIPTLPQRVEARHILLDGLSKLHVAGCAINWRRLFPEHLRCVKLPRYPWQRQRYWLSSPPALAQGSSALPPVPTKPEIDPLASLVYQVNWLPHSDLTRDEARTSSLKSVELQQVVRFLPPRFPELERKCRTDRLVGLRDALDELSAAYIFSAFASLGLNTSIGSRWPKADLEKRLKLVPRFDRLLIRLCDILQSAGYLRDNDAYWTVARTPTAAQGRSERLIAKFEDAQLLLRLHDRCGARLADVLRGQCDPLSLLFSEDDHSSAEAIYRDAAPSRFGNQAAVEVVREWVDRLPADRALRILEIGAGTGGTTSAVLPVLPVDRCEYVFTDLSSVFLKRAQQQFAAYPFVRYELLDLEQPPTPQGFAHGQFDLVIAANVFHATRDLSVSLNHARQLLSPGGVLLMLECTAPRPWMDITFGLTEGWWRFEDQTIRRAHPLISGAAWVDLLTAQGFVEATAVALQQPDTALLDQALVIARNPLASCVGYQTDAALPHQNTLKHYLVLADPQVSDQTRNQLRLQIEQRGSRVHLMDNSADQTNIHQALWRQGSACYAILYLADFGDSQLSAKAMSTSFEPALRLVQALLAANISPAGGLWLVTRGVQPAGSTSPTGLSQSLLWGFGRSVSLEAPQLHCRLIDLGPHQAPEQAVASLLAEVDHPGTEDQIALRHRQRFVARLIAGVPRTFAATESRPPLRVTGAHLITGGLGAIGGQLALHLAAAGASHLLLVVKHPLPPRHEWLGIDSDSSNFSRVQIVQELEALGTKVSVVVLDLNDDTALPRWLSTLDLDLNPLRGVWHAAMSYSFAPLANLDMDKANEMIRVKAASAWQLHELTRQHALDHFVLFSSTTSLWGAAGLAHYAAANAFLDALAHLRRSQALPATVVNWGTWQRDGDTSRVELMEAARVGLRPMPSASAIAALDRVLAEDICQVVVADVYWTTFKPAYEARRDRPFLAQIPLESGSNVQQNANAGSSTLVDRLQAARVEDRREMIASHLRDLLATVLGTPEGEPIDAGKGFFELGMDSLTSVQLRRRLERDLQRTLPSTLTFNYSTLDLLADYLHEDLFASVSEAVTEVGTPSTIPLVPPNVASCAEEIEATEDQLFDQLAEKLKRF